jgi:hypothetical protein
MKARATRRALARACGPLCRADDAATLAGKGAAPRSTTHGPNCAASGRRASAADTSKGASSHTAGHATGASAATTRSKTTTDASCASAEPGRTARNAVDPRPDLRLRACDWLLHATSNTRLTA